MNLNAVYISSESASFAQFLSCITELMNEEKSILDFIIVCEKLVDYFELMFIDEERNFPLTKYATTKGVRKMVESDHT